MLQEVERRFVVDAKAALLVIEFQTMNQTDTFRIEWTDSECDRALFLKIRPIANFSSMKKLVPIRVGCQGELHVGDREAQQPLRVKGRMFDRLQQATHQSTIHF
jgi:hypothetical protein